MSPTPSPIPTTLPPAAAFLAALPDAAVVLEHDGRVAYANPAAQRWLTRAEHPWIGREITRVWPALAQAMPAPQLIRFLAGDTAQRIELPVPGASSGWLELTSVPMDGRVVVVAREAARQPADATPTSETAAEVPSGEAPVTQREAWLQAALEVAQLGAYAGAADTKCLTLSDAAARIFGLADGQAARPYTGAWYEAHVHPEDRERWHAAWATAMATGGPFTAEYRVVRDDGGVRWVVSRAHPLHEPDGRAVRWVGVLADVTERRQAEAALRTEDARYRQLIETAPYAIIVHADGLVRFANPAAAQLICATDPDRLIGQPIARALRPEDVPLLLGRAQRVARGEALQPIEITLQRLDGQAIQAEILSTPILFEGRSAVQTIARDVSDRAQALMAMRQRSLVVDTITDAVLVLLPDGTILEANAAAARVLGFPQIELVGQTAARFYAPGMRALLEPAIREAIARTGYWSGEIAIQRRDGRLGTVDARLVAERDATGHLVRIIGIYRDITEIQAAQEQLRAREEAFRALAEHTPDIVVRFDRALHYVYANPAFETLTGHRAEAIVGRPAGELLVPSTAAWWFHALSIVLESGAPCDLTVDGVAATGAPRIFDARLVPECGADGRPATVLAVLRDVTDHRRAEAALRESEERYRSLVNLAPDGFLVHQDHRIVFANRAAAEIFRVEHPDKLLGRNPLEFVAPGADADAVRERNVQLLTETAGRVPPREYALRRADGTSVQAEVTAVRTVYDGRSAVQLIFRDITERKAAEAQQRETAQRLATFIDASPIAIVGLNEQMRITLWNAAATRIFGWTADEMLGQPYHLVPPEDRASNQAQHAALYRGERLPEFEALRLRKDGAMVAVRVSTAAVHGPNDDVTGVIAMLADVSAQRALEAQLRQAQKMEAVGRLAGGVAHDFNNLLTVITMNTSMVLRALGAGHPARADLLPVKQAADRAAELTQQLLTFSRRLPAKPRLLDLNTTIGEQATLLRRLLGEDLEIQVDLTTPLGIVRADPTQIAQVLINLAVNARDAMPMGGCLRIHTTEITLTEPRHHRFGVIPAGRYVTLSMSDTGTGISDDVFAHLFEPFFTTKDVGKGTGLGLSTVYGIVAQAGGHLGVDTTPGRGSTFAVYLPWIAEPTPAPAPAATPTDRTALPRGVETILVVEDEPQVRQVIATVLAAHGYNVLEAASGPDALRVADLADFPIHLVLTDLVMPQLTGHEFLLEFTARRPTTRVLTMTGYATSADATRGYPVLLKPFEPDELVRLVRRVLDSPPIITSAPPRVSPPARPADAPPHDP